MSELTGFDRQGLLRLERKVKRLPVIAKKNLRKALELGAEQINRRQRQLAQRSRRSGELIDGITWHNGDHELQLLVVSEAFYSRHVEFGTRQAAAQPFFFPGYRTERKSVKGKLVRAGRKSAKEIARGGG